MEDQKLKDYFKFDEADLEANRNSRFSEKQQARLIKNDKTIQKHFVWYAIPFLLVAAVGPYQAVSAGDFFGWVWIISWGFLWTGLWGGIGLILIASSLSKTKKLILAKAQGRVNLVRDRSYNPETHTHSMSLELHIGRKSFDVEDDITDVLMQGDEYIVYYEKDWQEIVSAELISQAK